jgi:hypothetical protein
LKKGRRMPAFFSFEATLPRPRKPCDGGNFPNHRGADILPAIFCGVAFIKSADWKSAARFRSRRR